MSGTVDTRTVEMRFDNKNFESNVKQSMSTLDKLKQQLKMQGADDGLKEIDKSSKKLDFKNTNRAVEKLGKSFSALETIATGVFLRIGMKAADAAEKMLKAFSVDNISAGWNKYAEKTTAVQTIMANIKDDASKFIDESSKMDYVNNQLEKLMWFSDETSYSFTDMTGNVGKFIATGSGLEESVTAMQGIATWAAMAGQNAQTASRVMYQLSQAMGTGKMTLMDWKSIETANMGTAQFKELAISIAEADGKLKEGEVTISNFRDTLQKGWFDKETMLKVFKEYGAAADKIRAYAAAHDIETSEAITEFKNSVKEEDKAFVESLGFKAFAAAQEAKTFAEVVGSVADAASTKWTKFFEYIFGDYLQAKKLWTDLSNDLYGIFIEPLNRLNSVMEIWNKGFFKDGPLSFLDRAYDSGILDDFENSYHYITKEAAQQAVELDSATYFIAKASNGLEYLVKRVKNADGTITNAYKHIFEPDLVSGRDMLIGGFKNIMEAFFTGYTIEEDGEVKEILSVLQTIRQAFLEAFFPGEDSKSLAKKIWDLTKKFQEFTERIKPTQETLDKLKNAFKGFFTIFKIGGKIIKAVLEPFANIFKRLFGGNMSSGILNAADSFSTWIQKLEKFLDTSKTFEKISNVISNGLDTISKALTGMSLNDLIDKIKNDVVNFFNDFDFQNLFDTIAGWLSKIDFEGIFTTILNAAKSVIDFIKRVITEISQLNGDQLPEQLTPIQNFWLGLKEIFNVAKSIIPVIARAFGNLVGAIGNAIGSLSKSDQLPDKLTPIQNFWLGLKDLFKGVKDVLSALSGPFRKVANFVGEVLTKIAGLISSGDNTSSRVSKGISRARKATQQGSTFLEELKKSPLVKGIVDFLKGFVYFLDSITPLLGAIGTFFGAFFTVIGNIIRNFTANTTAGELTRIITMILVIAGVIIVVRWIIWRIKSHIEWVKEGIEAVCDVAESITSVLEGIRQQALFGSLSNFIQSIAIAMLATAAAIAVMAAVINKIGIGKFLIVAGVLALFIGGIIAVAFIINKTFESGNVFKDKATYRRYKGTMVSLAVFMLAVAGSLLILAKAFAKMATVDSSKYLAISAIFAGFMVLVSSIAVGFVLILNKLGKIPIKKIVISVAMLAGFMITMAMTLNVVAKAFAKMATVDSSNYLAISAVFAGFLVLVSSIAVGFVLILNKLGKIPIKKIVISIAMLAGLMITTAMSLVIVSHAFAKMATVDSSNYLAISAVFAGFTAVAAGMALLGGFLLGKAKGAIIGVALMAGFMITAAVSLWIVAKAFAAIPNDISLNQMLAALAIMVVFGAIVATLAAIGAVLANTGVGAAGMALVALIIAAIGFACLAAGVAISLFVSSVSNLINAFIRLMVTVPICGDAFIESMGNMFDAALTKIAESKEKMVNAFVSVLLALAEAIIKGAPILSEALVILLIYIMKNVSDTINASTDMIAYTIIRFIINLIYSVANNIRLYAPELLDAVRQTVEAIIEIIILGLAGMAEIIPGIGKSMAKKIAGWIPAVRKAFGTQGGNVLKDVAAENIRLAESGEIAGNAVTDLTGRLSSLFSNIDQNGGILSNLLGGFGSSGVSLFGNLRSDAEDDMKGVTAAVKNETPEVRKQLKSAFDAGLLDDIENHSRYVSRSAAEEAAKSKDYFIKETEDGLAYLVRAVKDADGKVHYQYKSIYDTAEEPAESFLESMLSMFSTIGDASEISGADMITRFISGMSSKSGDLENAFYSLFPDSSGDFPTQNGSTQNASKPKGYSADLGTDAARAEKFLQGKGYSADLGADAARAEKFLQRNWISPIIDLQSVNTDLLRDIEGTFNRREASTYRNSANAGIITVPSETLASVVGDTNNYEYHNTFNIENSDPEATAKIVIKMLTNQVNRKTFSTSGSHGVK